MYYITGDIHGDWERVADFCARAHTTKDDVLIALGDVAVNFYGGARDILSKKLLSSLEITLFCVHGNHEIRPENIPGYRKREFCGATVLVEPEFPSIMFAQDGQIYNINNHQCIAIGGAYSVDKHVRLARGWGWWPDEQPSAKTKQYVERIIEQRGGEIDVVLSHTCPCKYIPRETFIHGIDQSLVDNSTEIWLDSVEEKLNYSQWYCGHYHTSKVVDRMRFMFTDVIEFN